MSRIIFVVCWYIASQGVVEPCVAVILSLTLSVGIFILAQWLSSVVLKTIGISHVDLRILGLRSTGTAGTTAATAPAACGWGQSHSHFIRPKCHSLLQSAPVVWTPNGSSNNPRGGRQFKLLTNPNTWAAGVDNRRIHPAAGLSVERRYLQGPQDCVLLVSSTSASCWLSTLEPESGQRQLRPAPL